MKNIAVTVNGTPYRQARVWAANHCTLASAVVTYRLQNLLGPPVAKRAFPLAKTSPARTRGACFHPVFAKMVQPYPYFRGQRIPYKCPK
jgi:hypothetical protein